MRYEHATTNEERRQTGAEDIRSALDRLQRGVSCEQCKWQAASVVVRRKRLLCASCAKVEHAWRNVSAIAARLHKKERG